MRTKPTFQARARKKSALVFLREWLNALLFAVVAATLIRFFTFEAYAIPTPSMESSLMVGEHLFVSKLHYGIRTPKTPLQLPLTHQKIWGTNLPSFSPAVQLPVYRFPGFSDVKKGDVVVFNYPPPKVGKPLYPTDMKTNFIKRCVGTPGDTLQIRQGNVLLNGQMLAPPLRAQTTYFIRTAEVLNDRFFRRYNLINDFSSAEGPFINWQPVEELDAAAKTSKLLGYRVYTTAETAEKLKKLDWITSVEPLTYLPGEPEAGIYGGTAHAWNRDNFGPIVVPRKGMTIPINPQTLALYGPVIERYEGNDRLILSPTGPQLNGRPVSHYTFKQNYYFMMGDNRHNSEDSRYWGFVPADHIVGKAAFVWMSIDPAPADVWHKIRWSRLFRLVD